MVATYSEGEASDPAEASSSALSWGPIVGGAFAAAALTGVAMLLGSGLGLTMVSPWADRSASLTTVAVTTAIWLIVVQWLSSAVGGYLTGRLRTKWIGIPTEETFFRDTAHGFLAWALATLLVISVVGSVASGAIGTGVKAASTVASGAAVGSTAAANTNPGPSGASEQTGYFVDALFRPAPTGPANPAADNGTAAVAQASRILIASAAAGGVSAEDKAYLGQLVAARTGLSQADATARVEAVLSRVNDAKIKAQQAADTARKAGATFALVGALSLIIGAFIAAVAAALGGRQRDEDEARFLSIGR